MSVVLQADRRPLAIVIDLAAVRRKKAERQARKRIVSPEMRAEYRRLMAQLRALRRIPGFEQDETLMRWIQPAYASLLARAEAVAPSQAVFQRDLKLAARCKAS